MPYKSRRRCLYPGCSELVNAGDGYCADHKPARKGDTSHYDRRWRKIRALYLAKHPLCVDCEKVGKLIPATEVHHIVAVNDGGTDNYDNLMGLCKPCHSRITIGGINHGR